MRKLIELKDVCKAYRLGEVSLPVLRSVSLEIEEGEMIALMGASGSGKSTLMNILGCLDRPDSGEFWFGGEEISQVSNDVRARIRNHKIGFVFQSFNLLARTSALDNVTMPLFYTAGHLSDREMRLRGMAALKRLGLEDRMRHDPSKLSGGQQQRVAIARALVNAPPVIFADEPTGNLDSRTSDEVLRLFQRLNREEGMTIVLVTHSDEVASHARRSIHIHDGRIVAGAFLRGAGGERDAA